MKPRRIKCFIAMPFGKKDCDALYKEQILPVLKSLQVIPIRVDQRQHKDDLNIFIIRMLNESDMALADLTYARPSVYYEAGYAERTISIVYTSRTDHLSRKQKDDNLRVHFDLEMKKIVDWNSPDDPSFSFRLKERMRYLIAPIKKTILTNTALDIDRAAFSSKSLIERSQIITNYATATFRLKRYSVIPLQDLSLDLGRAIAPSKALLAVKLIDDTCHGCVIVVGNTLSINQIKTVVDYAGINRFTRHNTHSAYKESYYFCTLQSLPENRLRAALPALFRDDLSGCYKMPKKSWLDDDRLIDKRIYLLPSINSISIMKKALIDNTNHLPITKTNRSVQFKNQHIYFVSDGKKAN